MGSYVATITILLKSTYYLYFTRNYTALTEKFWYISLYVTLYCKDLCDEKVRQIEGNGRKFSHKELSKSVLSYIF